MKDDLISRQAAINAIEKKAYRHTYLDQIIDIVSELPSAQPKPLTEAEVIICKLYLNDLDKYKTCNEYKLLMGLLDGTASVQPEPCEDCVSRTSVIRLLHSGYHRKSMIDEVEELPPAKPEPCEYAVSAMAVEEMLKDLLPERGMWEIEGDEAKTAICETVHDALDGLWRLPFVKPDSKELSFTQKAPDTISRQMAIDAFEDTTYTKNEIRRRITELPSAQPDIIRCRDCKYWREHKYSKETKRYIPFCGFNAIYTKADDFCSRAERRTDEQTD